MARDTAATTNLANMTKTLLFADGVAFVNALVLPDPATIADIYHQALDDLTSDEEAEIVAVAMSTLSSADVPSDLLKAQL